MNPEVTKLLSELASKMGTTIEYLWPKLVGHAGAEASAWFWVCVIAGSLTLVVAIALAVWSILGNHEGGPFVGSFFCALISLFAFLGAASHYADKTYPEAVAIQKLLNGR